MTGALQVTRPGITAAGQYVFSAKAEGLPSDKSVAFRVTADGGVKAGHDTGTAFMAKANNDVVTKKFVDTIGAKRWRHIHRSADRQILRRGCTQVCRF